MHLTDRSDGSGLDQFHDPAIVVASVNLRAQLRDSLLLGGGLSAKSAFLVPLTSTKGPLGVLTLVSTAPARRSSSAARP